MKVTIEIDCTPEEARRAMGLPDLTPLHDRYMAIAGEAMEGNVRPEMVEAMMRNWAPMGEAGMTFWRRLMDSAGKPGRMKPGDDMDDTIFAVSSGRPPAGIAVIRLSGPRAQDAATAVAGGLPAPRRASLRGLRDGAGALLDRALVILFPGPATATGEDVVEFHCHGGRAVTQAVERTLAAQPGCRLAEPGEFTPPGAAQRPHRSGRGGGAGRSARSRNRGAAGRRAGGGGRADQPADRQLAGAGRGAVRRIEAELDHADEDDVAADDDHVAAIRDEAMMLGRAIAAVASAPPVERLHDGIRVVIGGPPNAGKSTLLNLLAERDAAIVSPIAGTTRDKIEAGVRRHGIAYNMVDTAGLTDTDDVVEAIGVERATAAIEAADVLVWLADEPPPRDDGLWVHARGDVAGREAMPAGRVAMVRQDRPETVEALWWLIEERAKALLPRADALPLWERHRSWCKVAATALGTMPADPLLVGEHLREARRSLAAVIGVDATELMLDALFSRFCLGK